MTVDGNNNEIAVTTANKTTALINPNLMKRITKKLKTNNKQNYSHLNVLMATA